jgi:hypothetical protein
MTGGGRAGEVGRREGGSVNEVVDVRHALRHILRPFWDVIGPHGLMFMPSTAGDISLTTGKGAHVRWESFLWPFNSLSPLSGDSHFGRRC